MIYYIIEVKTTYTKPDKTEFTMTSYFEKIASIIPAVCLSGIKEEAKKFDCKSEAKRTIAKYFVNKHRCTVLKIETQSQS